MIEIVRSVAMGLFTLMNFVGAFKEGAGAEAFGSGNPLKDYTFLTVLGIALCFVIIFVGSSSKERNLILSRVGALSPLVAFGLYMGICQALLGSAAGAAKVKSFWVLVLPACCLFIGLIRRPRDLISFLWFITLFGSFMTSVSFIFKTRNPFLFISSGSNEGVSWTYIQYGALACSAGLITLIWAVEGKKSSVSKIFYLALCLFNYAGVIYSGERGSILFVPIIIFIYFIMSGIFKKIGSKNFFWIVLILTIVVIGATIYLQSDMAETFRYRYSQLGISNDAGEKDSRIDIGGENYVGVRQAIHTNPIFGLGPGNYFGFNLAYYPHNLFLEIFGELGLIGLLLYLFVLKKTWQGIHKTKKILDPNIYFPFLCIYLLYLFRTLKAGNIPGSRYFWLLTSVWILFTRIKVHKLKIINAKKT